MHGYCMVTGQIISFNVLLLLIILRESIPYAHSDNAVAAKISYSVDGATQD